MILKLALNENKDESPNVALLKLIGSSEEYLRKAVDGISQDVVFSERLETLKVLPLKKIEKTLRRNQVYLRKIEKIMVNYISIQTN